MRDVVVSLAAVRAARLRRRALLHFLETFGLRGERLLRAVKVDTLYLAPQGTLRHPTPRGREWKGVTDDEAGLLVAEGLATIVYGRRQRRIVLTPAGRAVRDALAPEARR